MLAAIDPGTMMGWARWQDGAPRPDFGVENLSAPSEGHVYLRARPFLQNFMFGVTRLAVEAPIVGKNSITSRLVLFGLRSEIIAAATAASVPVIEVEASRWRKLFIGAAQAPKTIERKDARRAWLKQRAREECERRGYGKVSSDAADALGILEFLRCSR